MDSFDQLESAISRTETEHTFAPIEFPKENYLNSRQLDLQMTWSDPSLDVSMRLHLMNLQIKGKDWETMKVILSNLWLAHQTDPESWVSYSRDKNWYSRPKRYNPMRITYASMLPCIEALVDHGYIEHKKGFANRELRIGYRSRMRGSDSFVRYAKSSGLCNTRIQASSDAETIILKDKEKRLVDYRDDSNTCRMRDQLRDYQTLLDESHVTLPGRSVPYALAYRVFNNKSFSQGGRFYGGWWQDLSEEERSRILIDGKPTVERDYGYIHLKLLYAKKCIDFTSDPYTLVGYEGEAYRKLFKKILLVALHAESENSALNAVRKAVRDNPEKFPKDVKLKQALHDFIEKHDQIKEYFFKPENGTKLQYLDSRIAERVLATLTNKGILVLPIHDSFIVVKEHDELLQQTMKQAFYEETNVEPKIRCLLAGVDDVLFRREFDRPLDQLFLHATNT